MEIDTESALFYGMIALCALVIITLIILLWHAGLFSEIIIKTCKPYIGEITVAYKFAQGPYKESGALFTQAHSLLPQYRTLGIYYDDPKKKESSRLRYIVGLIISENGKPVNEDDRDTLKNHGYSFASFPKIEHAVQTTFPFKSTISIIIAILRVYPALFEYIESRSLCAHPIVEVYDCDDAKIYYIGPLEKQNDFYVEELKDEEELNQLAEEEKSFSETSVSNKSNNGQESTDDNRNSNADSSSFEEIDEEEVATQ